MRKKFNHEELFNALNNIKDQESLEVTIDKLNKENFQTYRILKLIVTPVCK